MKLELCYNTYVKKTPISKLFLYRYRFIIGYSILGVLFISMLLVLPLIAQTDLSQAEIDSATSSYYLGKSGIMNGDLVDLPYRLLQKFSITLFGLSAYTIKLPSIVIGLLLGFLLILLLNRWFKNNVSILASCLIILSTPFLFLAGNGTPLIMIIFWPTLLLWLGSKIQGEKRPKPSYSFIFAICMLLSIFTPYMIYFALFCVVFVLLQPHLRFIIKELPKLPFAIVIITILCGFAVLGLNIIGHPDTLMELLFATDFHIGDFFNNIGAGLTLLFSWRANAESVFLTPLVGLPVFALALIGLFSTTKGFFASRNSIASLLLVFCLIITGFNSSSIVFVILPLAILVAHGIKYILEKWYGLFPENPYARVFALLPLTILFALIIIPSFFQYVNGYKYNPNVVNEFNNNLQIIKDNLDDETLLVLENYDFYKILENSSNIRVVDNLDERVDKLAVLKTDSELDLENYQLSRIITSSRSDNSDIIYLYTYSENNEGE